MNESQQYQSLDYDWVSELPRELIAAVGDDDVAKLQSLREGGENLNVVAKNGNTLLYEAIRHRKANVFDYLLTLEGVPLEMGLNGRTPINATFEYANEDLTLKLIAKGCNLDEVGSLFGDTLLHNAILHKRFTVAEKLIEEGVNVDYQDKRGRTPLYKACRYGQLDVVFMLLFYGADPLIEDCLGYNSIDRLSVWMWKDKKLQDFFLNVLYPHYKILTLVAVVDVMRSRSVAFLKLLEMTEEIVKLDNDSLQFLINGIAKYNPNHFKLFIDKFSDIVEQAIEAVSVKFFFQGIFEDTLHVYLKNLYIILSHPILGPQLVEKIHSEKFRVLHRIIERFRDFDGQLEAVTKLVCWFLSHGVDLYHEEIHGVFQYYGYCELFKIMLHMDISDEILSYELLMPALICDVKITVKGFVKYCDSGKVYKYFSEHNCKDLLRILDYFALPELKTFLLRFNNKNLTARVKRLPAVPSLVELARNSTRAHIISKYKTKNSRQFYTVLKYMPIAEVYKQIIAFERKLYLATNT